MKTMTMTMINPCLQRQFLRVREGLTQEQKQINLKDNSFRREQIVLDDAEFQEALALLRAKHSTATNTRPSITFAQITMLAIGAHPKKSAKVCAI